MRSLCGLRGECGACPTSVQCLPVLCVAHFHHQHQLHHHRFPLTTVTRPHTPWFSFLGLRQGRSSFSSFVTILKRDGVRTVDEHVLLECRTDCVPTGSVPHHTWKPHWASANKNLNVLLLLWNSSFSVRDLGKKVWNVLKCTLICGDCVTAYKIASCFDHLQLVSLLGR